MPLARFHTPAFPFEDTGRVTVYLPHLFGAPVEPLSALSERPEPCRHPHAKLKVHGRQLAW